MNFSDQFPIIEKDLYKDFIKNLLGLLGLLVSWCYRELPELLGFSEESARKKVFELSTMTINILAANATKQALNVALN